MTDRTVGEASSEGMPVYERRAFTIVGRDFTWVVAAPSNRTVECVGSSGVDRP